MNRRDFLKGVTLTSLGLTVAAEELQAQAPNKNAGSKKPAANTQKPQSAKTSPPTAVDDELKGRPVNCAVIGLGPRGREILAALAKMGDKFAPVPVFCDKFKAPIFVKKSQAIATKARFEEDYRRVLDDKSVEAVFIATPTHLHKQITLDALQAGKHVYCEAPLAHTIEDARTIAQAAAGAKTMFQPGLQVRCSLQAEHVNHFILTAVLGKVTGGRAQWHQRTSWRQIAPTDERQAELNWRLKRETSPGLLGEVGIHQIDTASWFLKALPVSVTAFGAIMEYNDGRDVPDTVQCIVEYPNNVRYAYDATLTSSFDEAYELFWGNDATVMLRDQRGWMFKEASSGQLGWEVFARKDTMQIGKPETGSGLQIASGIALVADATKQLALGKTHLVNDPSKSALYQSCRAFLSSVRAGKRVHVKEPTKEDVSPPLTPGPLEGYQATVVALKANEAALEGKTVVFEKEWFTL
jgi:predicted dehydrogenase